MAPLKFRGYGLTGLVPIHIAYACGDRRCCPTGFEHKLEEASAQCLGSLDRLPVPRAPQHLRGLSWHVLILLVHLDGLQPQESLGPFGPEVSRECPSGCLWHSRVSKKCPESVPRVSKRCPGHFGDTLGTLFGHSGARGPKGTGDTPRDTPGTLRARRARETPVAGWGGCNRWISKTSQTFGIVQKVFLEKGVSRGGQTLKN